MSRQFCHNEARGSIPTRAAFTLIEMLVVIGVIGILVGMLFPALRRAQAKSRQAACTNTLHQFGLAIIQYRHDHDDNMPPWLSVLYQDYMSSYSVYACPSDGSRGQEGSKPDSLIDQFKETDDTASNTSSNRNSEIKFCSYMYEYCDADCDPETKWWAGYVHGVDADSKPTWCVVKDAQLRNGDKFHPGAYNETDFPMVRCFHHVDEKEVRSKYDVNGQLRPDLTWSPMTLNLSYSGNVFPAPIKWEYKP